MAEKKIIHVVAGVLRDRDGKILLAQRPPGKHLAGLWEFPGGKRENGETPEQALRRELHEEIGVEAGAMRRIICFPWDYAEKSIFLDVYDVANYTGDPHGKELQAVRWEFPDALRRIPMPEADVSIVTALRLPDRYAITPEPSDDSQAFLAGVQHLVDQGIKLIQLRAKNIAIASLRSIALEAHRIAKRADAKLLLNSHVELARELGLDGVHLPAARVASLKSRPLDENFLVGASCHTQDELQAATDIGADFAVLGPVHPTASHNESKALGWAEFRELVETSRIPVFALGGLGQSDLPDAFAARAQGVAGISAFWHV